LRRDGNGQATRNAADGGGVNLTRVHLLAATAMVTGLVALSVPDTSALFTDTDAVGANTFTNSTIALTVSPTSALVSYSGMLPGDSVTNSIQVTNAAGSSALRYAISSSATNADALALKDQLVLTIKTVDVTTPATPCDNFDGTQLYTGDLDSTAGKLVGDNTTGAQAGDRPLAAGASEYLCFQVSLPIGTSNTYKLATTTATFTFDSEQTKNNP
jgi:spore coat-associated protein N